METSGDQHPRLLIVESNGEIRDVLSTLLTDEGYQAHCVASLQEALVLVDTFTFQLILADLFAGQARQTLALAARLLRGAKPTPVGVMTTQTFEPEEVTRQGFAFFLPKPFDVEQLLALIAAHLQQPLTPEQERQAEVVRRFFECIAARDWDALISLCTDDVTSYPPNYPTFAGAREIRSKAEHRDYMQRLFESPRLKNIRCEGLLISARPKGLAARYQNVWTEPDGSPRQLAAVMLFHFRGELISQIGLRTNTERLRSLLTQAR